MKLPELLRAAASVAQTGGDAKQHEAIAREAENLADMVSWAPNPIDPTGEWLNRLATVQDDLQQRYAQSAEPTLALLNDTLTRLGEAIAKHDSDLEANGSGDDGEDLI